MIDTLALAVALALPQQDQWSHLFDHGDRWSGCSVTFTSSIRSKPLLRAIGDVERASGVRLVPVPSGGQITIRTTQPGDPMAPWAAAGALSVGSPRYTSGTLLISRWVQQYPAKSRRVLWQHELGHILGLGHVDNPREVMYMFNSLRYRSTPGWVGSLRALYPECK